MTISAQFAAVIGLAIIMVAAYVVCNSRTTSKGAHAGPKPLDFFKTNQWCATMGHWLGGFFILFVPTFWALGSEHVLEWLTGCLLVAAALKEYWLDLAYESDEDVWSSTCDFIGWSFGALVAWGMAIDAWHVGVWKP